MRACVCVRVYAVSILFIPILFCLVIFFCPFLFYFYFFILFDLERHVLVVVVFVCRFYFLLLYAFALSRASRLLLIFWLIAVSNRCEICQIFSLLYFMYPHVSKINS